MVRFDALFLFWFRAVLPHMHLQQLAWDFRPILVSVILPVPPLTLHAIVQQQLSQKFVLKSKIGYISCCLLVNWWFLLHTAQKFCAYHRCFIDMSTRHFTLSAFYTFCCIINVTKCALWLPLGNSRSYSRISTLFERGPALLFAVLIQLKTSCRCRCNCYSALWQFKCTSCFSVQCD